MKVFNAVPLSLAVIFHFPKGVLQKCVWVFSRFEVRIEAMVLREEIFPLCAVMSREIDVVRVATKGKYPHVCVYTCSLWLVTRIFELMKS